MRLVQLAHSLSPYLMAENRNEAAGAGAAGGLIGGMLRGCDAAEHLASPTGCIMRWPDCGGELVVERTRDVARHVTPA